MIKVDPFGGKNPITIGKVAPDGTMPTKNNVYFLFEKGDRKIKVTIVDRADYKKVASMYTLIEDMSSRHWRDKTETGYRSAAEIDNTRVMTEYYEKEAKTTLNYNANHRFLVMAEAINSTPDKLWEHLKALNIKSLLD